MCTLLLSVDVASIGELRVRGLLRAVNAARNQSSEVSESRSGRKHEQVRSAAGFISGLS